MSYMKLSGSERIELEGENLENQKDSYFEHKSRRKIYWLISFWLLGIGITHGLTRWYYQCKPLNISPYVEKMAVHDYNSPVYKDIKLHIDPVRFDSSLWDEGTIYRQDPSPETDAAWEALTKWDFVLVSEEEMTNMGIPLEGSVQWPDDPTGRTYVAQMDVFHLVHCVDALRKGVFSNYYQRNKTVSPTYWAHEKHCLDTIRQEIMCTGSLNLYRMVWTEHQTGPVPEFPTNRQCRRWDDIVAWQEKHEVSREDSRKILMQSRPKDAYVYPMSPGGIRLVAELDEWLKKLGLKGWKRH